MSHSSHEESKKEEEASESSHELGNTCGLVLMPATHMLRLGVMMESNVQSHALPRRCG
jgi:hypothetical protein